jgi:O-acetyl-ADP-ribose deacetylase (regulator of RNase III)
MKIEYVHGNLFASTERVIAHGCNAQGVMKSGVAKVIREAYPQAYQDYRNKYEHSGLYLGEVIETQLPGRTILNIISQQYYGRDPNIVYVSYDAIFKAVKRINEMGHERVGFPLIGAGLANGNWNVIAAIIESYANFTPVVYHLDPRA